MIEAMISNFKSGVRVCVRCV